MNLYSEHKLTHNSRVINKIWVLDNQKGKVDIQNLKILPNGCFNFALLIGKGASAYLNKQKYDFKKGIYLCSQLTEFINLTLLKKSKVILIQLKPWYFSYYKQSNFNYFVNTISESQTNKLFYKNINLNSSSILQDVIELAENYSLEFEKNNTQNFIEELCRIIISNNGNIKISDILQKNPYSERWIQSIFKKNIGLTPKQFSKIIQFRNSVDEIAFNKKGDTLTSIGYKSGYNDQSHFVKNFNQFSKTTPSKFNPDNYILSYKK